MIRRGGVTDIAWIFALGNKVSHIYSTLHRARCSCKYGNDGNVLSQLSVLASHKTNFESVAQGA